MILKYLHVGVIPISMTWGERSTCVLMSAGVFWRAHGFIFRNTDPLSVCSQVSWANEKKRLYLYSFCISLPQDAHGVNLDNKGLVIANTVHLPLPCFCLTFCLRLKEIDMSEYDAATYERFSSAVRRQVQSLRIILDSLQVGVTPHTVCV